MKTTIVLLGPIGATFSSDAYDKLALMFDTPQLGDDEVEAIPVIRNGDILPTLLKYPEGYGTIAMETKAEGRVAEPLESFIELLSGCPDECSFHVIGAIKMKLHFALMTRPGIKLEDLKGIVAHPKSLGACRKNIQALSLLTADSTSNGKAAEDVSKLEIYEKWAALGPESAAKKYGLGIINDQFEDLEAITTFFLLAPKSTPVVLGESNRVLIIYNLRHVPGSLVDSLIPFRDEGLNLIQIHSVYVGEGNYSFAIELDCPKEKIEAFHGALQRFLTHTIRSLVFGPFEVRSG